MSKSKIYSMYDSASETYAAPFISPAKGHAIRSFQDAVNKPSESPIFNHPDHFTLFEVGEFDFQSGLITVYEAKVSVANGIDLKTSVSA